MHTRTNLKPFNDLDYTCTKNILPYIMLFNTYFFFFFFPLKFEPETQMYQLLFYIDYYYRYVYCIRVQNVIFNVFFFFFLSVYARQLNNLGHLILVGGERVAFLTKTV